MGSTGSIVVAERLVCPMTMCGAAAHNLGVGSIGSTDVAAWFVGPTMTMCGTAAHSLGVGSIGSLVGCWVRWIPHWLHSCDGEVCWPHDRVWYGRGWRVVSSQTLVK